MHRTKTFPPSNRIHQPLYSFHWRRRRRRQRRSPRHRVFSPFKEDSTLVIRPGSGARRKLMFVVNSEAITWANVYTILTRLCIIRKIYPLPRVSPELDAPGPIVCHPSTQVLRLRIIHRSRLIKFPSIRFDSVLSGFSLELRLEISAPPGPPVSAVSLHCCFFIVQSRKWYAARNWNRCLNESLPNTITIMNTARVLTRFLVPYDLETRGTRLYIRICI